MKLISRLLLVLCIWQGLALAQTEHLTGTVNLPNAAHFNGYLRLSTTVASIKNICVTPFAAVPKINVTYPIVNGVPQGLSTANLLSQDCMMPRIPYYVEISDTNNIVQSNDNWYIPRTITGTADIGAMQEQHFGGPITVAIPYGIIAVAQVAQSVTQAPSTSFNFITSGGGKLLYNGVEVATGTGIPDPLSVHQILVNGGGGSNQIEVGGYVDVSGGYKYFGGATAGTCLVGNGTAYVPGSCSPAFPTLYYQYIAQNSVLLPQRGVINHSSFFNTTDEGGNQTLVDARPIGIAGSYNYPTNVTTNSYGQITSITSGSASGTGSGSLTTPSGYWVFPGGFIYEWLTGTVESDTGGAGNPLQTNPLPAVCPTAVLSVQVTTFVAGLTMSDSTHGPTETLHSFTNTQVSTQRYRLADHGSDPSAPYITVICH